MIAFTVASSTLWTVPNDTPQIATADGGVIGASGTIYDQNGIVTGQTAALTPNPTSSSGGQWPGWLANPLGMAYSVTGSAFVPISYATTFAALLGGNNSGTGTNVQQEWFPELPSCPLAPPGPLKYGDRRDVPRCTRPYE